jgi:hypothetical protein
MNIKFTKKDGMTYGGFRWPLPTKNADGTWTPGEWTRRIKGDLELCENGYHFTDDVWCAAWIDAEMYEIEIDGKIVTSAAGRGCSAVSSSGTIKRRGCLRCGAHATR